MTFGCMTLTYWTDSEVIQAVISPRHLINISTHFEGAAE